MKKNRKKLKLNRFFSIFPNFICQFFSIFFYFLSFFSIFCHFFLFFFEFLSFFQFFFDFLTNFYVFFTFFRFFDEFVCFFHFFFRFTTKKTANCYVYTTRVPLSDVFGSIFLSVFWYFFQKFCNFKRVSV